MKRNPIDRTDIATGPIIPKGLAKLKGLAKPKGLGREERLSKRIDLIRVFKSPSWMGCEGLKLCYRKNNLPWNRIAVTTVKGFKGAVQRNRQKRISREIYRELKHSLKAGFDMIFILRPGEYSSLERKKQIQLLLEKANMILDE